MLQKDYVNKFLVDNFERIQKERLLNGFSWKPIVQQILTMYPQMLQDPKLVLDPENEVHRDRIRNNFLNIRKRKQNNFGYTPPLKLEEWKTKVMDELEVKGRKQFEDNLKLQHGKVERIFIPDESSFKYLDTYNKPQSAPTNDEEEFKQWKQEKDRAKKQQGMHIVIGCVHLPAVNKEFYSAFLKFVKDSRADLKGIHLIGDIIDCKSLSTHDRGQTSDTTLEEEYHLSNLALDELDACLPAGIERNYIWGNHEDRYARAMKGVDMSKFGGALLSPTKGCKFVERGYTVQESYLNGKIVLGKHLDLIHGQFITQNSSKKHLDVYKKSIMFAHTHKMGAHFDGDKASFNIGWMGDSEHSAFNYCSRLTKSQWQNGFAVVNIDSDGFYHVQLVQWYNGKFIFGNKIYNGEQNL